VYAATPAELPQLQTIRVIAFVLDRRVIAFLAYVALQRDDCGTALGRGHVSNASNTKET
jgi:hypothetical protein